MLDLGGADAEGQRAHGAVRRGVAVAADDGHARLAETLFRPDDVDNALVKAGDRKVRDPELLDVALEHVDLKLRLGIVDARSAGRPVGRRDVVVRDRHRRVGAADLAPGELQPFKGLRRRDLVNQVKIDVDQAGIGILVLVFDDVAVPDLVE